MRNMTLATAMVLGFMQNMPAPGEFISKQTPLGPKKKPTGALKIRRAARKARNRKRNG